MRPPIRHLFAASLALLSSACAGGLESRVELPELASPHRAFGGPTVWVSTGGVALGDAATAGPAVVTLDSGRLAEGTTLEPFVQRLRELRRSRPLVEPKLRVDRRVPYPTVLAVASALKQAGVRRAWVVGARDGRESVAPLVLSDAAPAPLMAVYWTSAQPGRQAQDEAASEKAKTIKGELSKAILAGPSFRLGDEDGVTLLTPSGANGPPCRVARVGGGDVPTIRRGEEGRLTTAALREPSTRACRAARREAVLRLVPREGTRWGEVVAVAEATAFAEGCAAELTLAEVGDEPSCRSALSEVLGKPRKKFYDFDDDREFARGLVGPSSGGSGLRGTGRGASGVGRAAGLGGLGTKGRGVGTGTGTGCNHVDALKQIRRARGKFRRCYTSALKRRPALKGSVRLELDVAPTGKVTKATVKTTRTSLKDPKVHACMIAVARSMTFKRSRGTCRFSAPFYFANQKTTPKNKPAKTSP